MDELSDSDRSGRDTPRSLRQRLQRPVGLSIAIVGFVSACLGIYGFFLDSSDSAPALSAEENRLLGVMPPKLGRYCRAYDPGSDPRYSPLVSASLRCAPIDEGPDSVQFHLFTTPRDLEMFMKFQREETTREGATCTSNFNYSSPWVDRRGEAVGEIQCAEFSDRSRLLWSYEDLLVVASAGSRPADAEKLHSWWQRQVRFDGGLPPARYRRHLIDLLPSVFRHCRPQRILLPMSLAGVICRPGEGISSAGAELFASRKALGNYIEQQAQIAGIGTESCGESPFSYMDYGWGPDYEPTLGYLLCRPNAGAQWFEWTAEGPRVYAFASREDGDFVRLYEQWTSSLSWIKGVRSLEGSA